MFGGSKNGRVCTIRSQSRSGSGRLSGNLQNENTTFPVMVGQFHSLNKERNQQRFLFLKACTGIDDVGLALTTLQEAGWDLLVSERTHCKLNYVEWFLFCVY